MTLDFWFDEDIITETRLYKLNYNREWDYYMFSIFENDELISASQPVRNDYEDDFIKITGDHAEANKENKDIFDVRIK